MNDSKRVFITQFIAREKETAEEKINLICERLENEDNNILSIKVTFDAAMTSLVIVYSMKRKEESHFCEYNKVERKGRKEDCQFC